MAKNGKKDPSPEAIMKKKFRRFSRKLMYVLLGIAAYFLLLPKVMPSAVPQVENTRTTFVTIYSGVSSRASKILGAATKAVDELGINKGELTNKSPEEFIDDKVEEIKAKLGSLPQEEALKIKKQFCQDLVLEAQNQCSANSSDNE